MSSRRGSLWLSTCVPVQAVFSCRTSLQTASCCWMPCIKRFPDFLHWDANISPISTRCTEIAASLSQVPGRKNVLWFSGGSTLFLISDVIALQNDAGWRGLYDVLDQERIAIYPIDARGLISEGRGLGVARQHLAMDEVAQSTGGRAFYNNNGLKEITEHLLDTDVSFYTLTYSPRNLRFDNKWHKVRVAVDGASYHLSYRSGYFADGSVRENYQTTRTRTRLLGNGEKQKVTELSDRPIIFQASVLPASEPVVANLDKTSGLLSLPPRKKGSVRFLIHYTVPIDTLAVEPVHGKYQVVLGVIAIALSLDGEGWSTKPTRLL